MTWDECYKRLAEKADEVKKFEGSPNALGFLDLLAPVGVRDPGAPKVPGSSSANSSANSNSSASGSTKTSMNPPPEVTFCASFVDQNVYLKAVSELLEIRIQGPSVREDLVEALRNKFGLEPREAIKCADAILKAKDDAKNQNNSANIQSPEKSNREGRAAGAR